MEKSRKAKKIVLITLLLVVVGLSIGFAAFNSNLTIKTTATVKGDDSTFRVAFSSSSSELVGGSATTDGTYASGGTFIDGATEISDLTAAFTAPGQTATWEFYAYNAGEFDAYLNTVTIGSITCTAQTGTTQGFVDEAAKGISIKVQAGEAIYETTTAAITGHKLTKKTAEKIKVTLTYADGSSIADGDFDVSVGDIILNYESID